MSWCIACSSMAHLLTVFVTFWPRFFFIKRILSIQAFKSLWIVSSLDMPFMICWRVFISGETSEVGKWSVLGKLLSTFYFFSKRHLLRSILDKRSFWNFSIYSFNYLRLSSQFYCFIIPIVGSSVWVNWHTIDCYFIKIDYLSACSYYASDIWFP